MFITSLLSRIDIQKIKKGILDTLFPLACLGCDKNGTWLCPSCFSALPRRLHQSCPQCLRAHTPRGELCFSCKDTSFHAYDGIFVASRYSSPLLKYLIHAYKYRFFSDISSTLGELLREALEKSSLPLPDLILPVPLHKRRLRFRGFNQSALLAHYLSTSLTPSLPLFFSEEILKRIRYTRPQMKTENREERTKNLHNAFSIDPQKSSLIQGKDIWLVDDVATTGTTLEECAKVLKKAGARSVFGIVLAR